MSEPDMLKRARRRLRRHQRIEAIDRYASRFSVQLHLEAPRDPYGYFWMAVMLVAPVGLVMAAMRAALWITGENKRDRDNEPPRSA